MKICPSHWDKLRAALDERGLTHLVGNADSAREQITGELEGVPGSQLPRDPLLSASFSIMGVAIKNGGLYLMEGDYCPICEAVKHTTGVWRHPLTNELMTADQIERWWLDGPADAELQAARDRGSVPEAQ